VPAILTRCAGCWARGGHLLCVEADVSGLAIPPEATVEADLERCWVDWGSP
jgi:hypothetical protein